MSSRIGGQFGDGGQSREIDRLDGSLKATTATEDRQQNPANLPTIDLW